MIRNFTDALTSRSRRTRVRRANAATKRLRLKKSLGVEPLESRRLLAGVFGYKFEDLNANGVDDGEPRIQGVEIRLVVNDGINTPSTFVDITNASGEYEFQDLVAGTMTVTETPPPVSVQTTPDPAPFFLNDGEFAVAFAGQSGTDSEVVIPELAFGNVFLGSIHGFKFEDVDANGIYDPNSEPPVPNVTFTLTGIDEQGLPTTRTTGTEIDGEFWFSGLLPGTYTVTETVPPGSVPTTEVSRTFVLESGQELVAFPGQAMLPTSGDPREEIVVGDELIFGNTVPGSIHGFKFEDIDGDGIYDPNFEPPLAGVAFTLTGVNGQGSQVTLTTSTTPEGEYWFTNLLPGTYTVTELVPPGFVPTTPISSTFQIESRQEYVWRPGAAMLPPNDPRFEVLADGIEFDSLTFGNTVPGSIHGFKFEDIDGDGIYDPNFEQPLAGVTFQLTGTGITGSSTVTTGLDGEFWFTNLLPGLYTVTESVPPGFAPTTPVSSTFQLESRQEYVWRDGAANLPSNDPRFEVLADGVEFDSLTFGNTVPGSIHGFKFEDIDGDGIYDPNFEPPLAGVAFTLTGVNGQGSQVTLTTSTTPEGEYWFTNLLPGTYTVTELVPPGFVPTTPISSTFQIESRQEYVWRPGRGDAAAERSSLRSPRRRHRIRLVDLRQHRAGVDSRLQVRGHRRGRHL